MISIAAVSAACLSVIEVLYLLVGVFFFIDVEVKLLLHTTISSVIVVAVAAAEEVVVLFLLDVVAIDTSPRG